MHITVSNIPDSGLEEELKISVTFLDDMTEVNVPVSLKIFRVGDKVLINGKVKTEASLQCSRCLENFSYPLDVKFEVEYVPFQEFIRTDEELTREELDVSFYKNDQIDIEEIVREHLLLAVPMKPLCKSDCRGICPRCGINLNADSCKCNAKEIDPRLSALKEFQRILKDRKE